MKRNIRHKRSCRTQAGVVGDWLGVPTAVWVEGVKTHPFVRYGEDGKLHVALVPEEFRDHVFKAMGQTYSWSQHLAKKWLADAVLLGAKPALWHHGVLTPGQMVNSDEPVVEVHQDRHKKSRKPWGNHAELSDQPKPKPGPDSVG